MKIRTRIFIYIFLSSALIIIGMSLIGDQWLVKSYLKHEIKHGEKVARLVVLESVGLILTDDRIRLRNLYQSAVESNYIVAYMFAEEDNEILAHTFEGGVPGELLNLGEFPAQSNLDMAPIEDEEGSKFYHIRVKIGKLSSAVFHLGLSEQKIKEELVPFRRVMLLVGCFLLMAVPFSMAYFLSRIISKPISVLRQGSERIGRGELDYRLNIKTGDEIEQLAEEFNRMSEKLEVNYTTLEQKVAERTESLRKEINERKQALDELKHHQQMLQVSERKLKEFSRKILSVREEEKKKLSSSLHDELGSMTVALGSSLSITEEEIKDNNLQGGLDGINQTKNVLKQSVKKLKKLSRDLRPPNLDIVGLPSVLKQYFSDIQEQTKINIDFNGSMDGGKISDDIAIVLYRVNQEALNNVIKHARAKKVKVNLYFQGNSVILIICDDGKGFAVEERLQKTDGFGIQGMKERIESLGGTFIIRSVPKKGTEISTTIPL